MPLDQVAGKPAQVPAGERRDQPENGEGVTALVDVRQLEDDQAGERADHRCVAPGAAAQPELIRQIGERDVDAGWLRLGPRAQAAECPEGGGADDGEPVGLGVGAAGGVPDRFDDRIDQRDNRQRVVAGELGLGVAGSAGHQSLLGKSRTS